MYFNGDLHGFNGRNGYVAPRATTLLYCDDCAPAHIPNWGHVPENRKDLPDPFRWAAHWSTDFRWAPYWGEGGVCSACKKSV